MEKELTNENVNETEVTNNEYIDAIATLKQNSVDKARYESLRQENKKLLDALVNGGQLDAGAIKEEPKEDIKTLRDRVFKKENQSNLEYWTNVLALRDRLLEEGQEDPFVPQGRKIQATVQDYEAAQRVADGMKSLVEYANGNNEVFISEYQRRVRDTSKTIIKK
ncbi:MAG TPA: hypothetical protein VFC79_13710 [Tissierellaceae bacterium]|nr:hypothetical protein [Tissierellaceae bacterium]